MAKSKETFNKKERQKRKQQQKQAKKDRMEQRKVNSKKGRPLEEMMAYMDENGNLSDKPPDPKNKRKINAEDIQIAVPKREEIEDVPKTGVVIFFDEAKGFGFINEQEKNERIFFHVNNLTEAVSVSDKVSFMVEYGPRGASAINVTRMV